MGTLLRMTVCFALAVGTGAGRGDDKKGDKKPVELKGWGRVVDPDGDCTVTADGGKLTVSVPATRHDLHPRNGSLNAPRVVRDVAGDFTATVRVTGAFKPGAETTVPQGVPFVSAGLLVWADEENYARLERNRWLAPGGQSACFPPLFEVFEGGESTVAGAGTADEFFQGKSTWLRLRRAGGTLTASVSHDGKEWTKAMKADIAYPDKVRLGVSAINTSNRTFSVEFDQFRVVGDN